MSPDLFLLLVAAASVTALKLASLPYSSIGSTLGQQDRFHDTVDGDFDEDAESIDHSIADSDPAFSIDGTAMSGTYDTNGFPQSHYDGRIDHGDTDHISFDDDPFEHTPNVGCSLICGDIDMHGDPCGVTDWQSDSWGNCDITCSSMFD